MNDVDHLLELLRRLPGSPSARIVSPLAGAIPEAWDYKSDPVDLREKVKWIGRPFAYVFIESDGQTARYCRIFRADFLGDVDLQVRQASWLAVAGYFLPRLTVNRLAPAGLLPAGPSPNYSCTHVPPPFS